MCVSTRMPSPARPARLAHHARARREIARRIFGVHAALDGAARRARIAHCARRRPSPAAMAICSATRSTPGDRLGHRMLDLDARVHLEEDRTRRAPRRPGIPPCRRRDTAGCSAKRSAAACRRVAQRGRQTRRRRLLDQLLVAALHRAVALAEVDDTARAVAQHLHFDVAARARRSAPGRRARRRRPRRPRRPPVPARRPDPASARPASCRGRRHRPPP